MINCKLLFLRYLPVVMLGIFVPLGAHASTSGLPTEYSDKLRSDFRGAYTKAQGGDRAIIKRSRSQFEHYPLWPDLQAASYRTQLGRVSDQQIAAFVAAHPDKSSVINLRYRWMKSLAKRGKWSQFKSAFDTYYGEANDDQALACLHVRALALLHPGKRSDSAALNMWMSGASLPDECNPVFNSLQQRNKITTKLLRKRIDLALAEGNTKLAQYLAKSAHKKDVARVDAWVQMRRNPLDRLKRSQRLRDNEANRELLFYGLSRAARRDPAATYKIWPTFRDRYHFSNQQKNLMLRNIALSAARDHLPVARQWLAEVDEHNVDSASWYVRRSLAASDWPGVYHATSVMPIEDREDDTWRYWRARALEAMGQSEDAKSIYRQVAIERSYYGFLAADRIVADYAFNHQVLQKDESLQLELAADSRVIRAYELFRIGQFGLARSEWTRIINTLDDPRKQQAALLAGEWNWHSRAINTMARSSASDVMLSYPTPYKSVFYEATSQAGIDRTWAYGIARTESLFMPDVRSSANAYGLMQIIPSTGRLAAKTAHINYRGRSTLLDPETNIKLGTHYLGQIFSRFGDNQVLATAAYNAGPHRVKGWLPTETWQADVWIENIPFTETRRYVKRVLAAQAVTHWRLTGTEQRLAGMMPPILSNPGTANRFASK